MRFSLRILKKIALKPSLTIHNCLHGIKLEAAVVCPDYSTKYLVQSTNNIIYFSSGSCSGYFRECRLHKNRRDYLCDVIDDYFSSIIHDLELGKNFKLFLMAKLKSNRNLRKFFKMGIGWGGEYPKVKAPYKKFIKTHDSSVIGIELLLPEWFEEVLKDFVGFARWPVYDFEQNRHTLPGQYQIYFSSKMKATKIIADLLACSEIVPQTKYICLQTGNFTRLGVATEPAQGISPDDIDTQNLQASPEFQRQLLNLNVLDVICFQKDHRPGNYFVIVNNGTICGVSAFDNDAPETFFPSSSVEFMTYKRESPFVSGGRINRPCFDRETACKLFELNDQRLHEALSPFLSKIEVRHVCLRVKKLQKALKLSLESREVSLLDKCEFSQDTMLEELSGKYGKTYLAHFANEYGLNISKVQAP